MFAIEVIVVLLALIIALGVLVLWTGSRSRKPGRHSREYLEGNGE